MSYSYIIKYDSRNYTPASQAVATWGRPRTIEAIAIHWWGDPNQNPTFQGIVNHLISPSAGVSAHFVASGTGRQVAQLVNLSDASWATNSANPYTISIECDPRCRPEDYDVVAEVIAQIRDAYGNLPLVPHNKFVATACPGNYSLSKLDALAKTKDGSGKWGTVKNKAAAKPTTPKWIALDTPRKMVALADVKVFDLVAQKYLGTTIKKGTTVAFETKTTDSKWLRTVYSTGRKLNHGLERKKFGDVPVKPPVVVVPPKETPSEPTESPSNDGFTESDRSILIGIKQALESLTTWLKSIFK